MPSVDPAAHANSAYYGAACGDFLAASPDAILGALNRQSAGAVEEAQRDAWSAEIEVLKAALRGIAGTVFLEFDVPRIGSRIDAVVISGPVIFPLEFKVGEAQHRLPAVGVGSFLYNDLTLLGLPPYREVAIKRKRIPGKE